MSHNEFRDQMTYDTSKAKEEEWVYHPSGKFKIKKEDKCFGDDCYNYGVVEWKAMECFVCRDCAKTILRNVKKFTKQWEK
tara:strand:- start:181 stop:420 length:240 start_codon:yes stop_codon:yes gene_type:complete